MRKTVMERRKKSGRDSNRKTDRMMDRRVKSRAC